LLQAKLPGSARSTLTVLTAGHPSTLLAQTDALIQPAVWSQLGGDLVLWQGDEQIASQMVGSTYTIGQAPFGARFGFLLSRHPWFWGIVVGVFGSPARRADLAAAAAFLSSPPRPQTAPDRRPAAVGLMRHDRTDVAHITV